MNEEQYLRQLVERFTTNQANESELEVFFFMLEEGKLDDILMEYMDADQYSRLMNHTPEVYSNNNRVAGLGKRAVAIAALILVFIIAGVFVYRNGYLKSQTETVTYSQISTKNNELKSIELSDGSLVYLNVNSTLKYAEKFIGDKRQVELVEGEAYFDIKHDKTKPFVVKTGSIITNVLGTAFNIRSYKYINTVKITVTRGKVGVQNQYQGAAAKKTVILNRDEQVDVDRLSGSITKNKVKAAEVLNWREGGLCFNNDRFRDVAAILEQKFNLNIRFSNDSISDYRFTAGFKANEKLVDILDALSLANNLTYSIKNNTVTLKKR